MSRLDNDKRIYYKDLDWEIGDWITCTKLEADGNPEDFTEQHLTIGKKYKIQDLDFHFPDSVCVKSDNGKISMFLRCALFVDDIKDIRRKKLEEIEKNKK